VIGWRGHVVIVLDEGHIIQSRVGDYRKPGNRTGVRIESLETYLPRLLRQRVPVNDWDDEVPEGNAKFVVRRWYGRVEGGHE
jgi:hypothetical protein